MEMKEIKFSKAIEQIVWNLKWNQKFLPRLGIYIALSWIALLFHLRGTLFVSSIVDELVKMQIKPLMMSLIIYASCSLFHILFTMAARRVGSRISYEVYQENSVKVYQKIMISDWEQLSAHHTGDLISRLERDVEVVSDDAMSWIPTIMTEGLKAIIAIGVIVHYDATLFLIILLVSPIVFVSGKAFVGKMYVYERQLKAIDSSIVTFEKDSFHNIQMIKSFDLVEAFADKMQALAKRCRQIGLEVNKYEILSWSIMYLSGQIAAAICLGWVIFRVYQGRLSVGDMAMLAVFASYIAEAFKAMIQVVPNMVSTVASVERVRGLLAMDTEEYPQKQAAELVRMKGKKQGLAICISHLSFCYANQKQVFFDVNLLAKPNEIVALVGPSGEGKTTMLRILLGLVKPQEGTAVVYPGQEKQWAVNLSPATRNMIAYVPQGNAIFTGTVADNLRVVVPDATDEQMIQVLKLSCAYEFVENLPQGIHYRIKEDGGGFSEGQNQRIAIARALLCHAPILLLDEATSALDVGTERKVLQQIMKSGYVRTCILTTHRPTVLSMCHRVYQIRAGNIRQIEEKEIMHLMKEF